ncbi:iron-sulfur cluster carrier protein [Maritalea myrionectae]|uniref:Iron-sulfur cluster carrier protein n=1 Tax=Maritalea myrionectae TaxID=454601 RepID=A0A2R4MHI3_9HYPH|nr:Mrp/NBP35 family ATP-binding protein [Maritalea myrionectae]AVX05354.1 iron-sulfur cluster carrier protein [Maritalea myrionectae]
MSDKALEQSVRNALTNINLPGGGVLSEFPGLSDVIVTQSAVAFAITVQPGMEAAFKPIVDAAKEAVSGVAGDKKVMVSLTSDKAAAQKAQSAGQPKPTVQKEPVKGVKTVIAVASGKGGVGKSTTAVNLALAFAHEGKKVGILDADIYGPSIPKLLGIHGKPAVREDGIFAPHEAYGLKVMSIGSMLEGDQAVMWRGPMASSALKQLLRETDWGELDLLVIDLPPGTGDVHISLVQQVEMTGAVIVSTPQDLALIDARKAIDMFARTQTRILGLIENMSYFECPDCGSQHHIFGDHGAENTAKELGLKFLGGIPLQMAIRENSDSGKPVVATMPESIEAKAFLDIAKSL